MKYIRAQYDIDCAAAERVIVLRKRGDLSVDREI